ncbi:hypothetical protein [Halomonas alkalisoli]|uniref:hypothetical protein n=1 Tax=Halomonas alkalisoli TaxID=2907158 RepID=UPI001F19738D|nr:hypothetical protein [Halomonas alkalisoli]MCE9684340.1 hypothetical protein [Halomonas alkalisoli]
MYNTDLPTRAELPSTRKLIRSTLVAAVVAAALLVTVVLPSEYAIDPTGAGRLLGLTQMGEIKNELAEEAALDQSNDEAPPVVTTAPVQVMAQSEHSQTLADASSPQEAPSPPAEETATWRDEVSFILAPGEGTEYKLTMEEGAVVTFAWASDGGPLNFDTHGDGNGNSISYEKGRGVPDDEGELKAAFTGNHGWFFRNRNGNDVTVVLRISGDYGELKRKL